jgi:hemerythrin
MALVIWTDKLSVGVKSIDEQHTVLFETINDLHAAMMKGQARSVIGDLLSGLLVYTRDHFSAEEEMLDSAQYPGLHQHKILHRLLTEQVEDFVARQKRGEITLSQDVSSFLSEWLTTHIQNEDQQYGPWMNDHGVR